MADATGAIGGAVAWPGTGMQAGITAAGRPCTDDRYLMSASPWIGLSTKRRAVVRPGRDPGGLLPEGTLLAEVEARAAPGEVQTLFAHTRGGPWPLDLSLRLAGDGTVIWDHRQGAERVRAAARIERPVRDDRLRITLTWHAPERVAVLSVEAPDGGEFAQTIVDDPLPLPQAVAMRLAGRHPDCAVDPGVALIAVADTVEPVGGLAGYADGTRIETPLGPRAIETLRAGDLVLTATQGFQPVRACVRQEVPALGRQAPVRLRAPYFGLRRDLTVAPDLRLSIDGVDAEYLFGTDAVLVEARHLARAAAAPAGDSPTMCYTQLVLDTHACISVDGAWGESLNLGDLRARPLRHATSALSGVAPDDLPLHEAAAQPVLKGYEAMVFVSTLCA